MCDGIWTKNHNILSVFLWIDNPTSNVFNENQISSTDGEGGGVRGRGRRAWLGGVHVRRGCMPGVCECPE